MDGVSATGNGCATGVKFVTEGKSLSDSRSGCAELRKADAEGRAAPVKAVVDCDRTMMDVDDALDDGEPEACARGLGAERAVEAVEDAFALLGGDARTVVADFDDCAVGVRIGSGADFDAPACSARRCP